MEMSNVEEALKRVQGATISYLMELVQPEELVDVNVSLSFENGVLNVEVEASLHKASLKEPNEIAKRVAQYALDLFDSMWGKALERDTIDKNGKRGKQNSHH
jgi:hypothetical protein